MLFTLHTWNSTELERKMVFMAYLTKKLLEKNIARHTAHTILHDLTFSKVSLLFIKIAFRCFVSWLPMILRYFLPYFCNQMSSTKSPERSSEISRHLRYWYDPPVCGQYLPHESLVGPFNCSSEYFLTHIKPYHLNTLTPHLSLVFRGQIS